MRSEVVTFIEAVAGLLLVALFLNYLASAKSALGGILKAALVTVLLPIVVLVGCSMTAARSKVSIATDAVTQLSRVQLHVDSSLGRRSTSEIVIASTARGREVRVPAMRGEGTLRLTFRVETDDVAVDCGYLEQTGYFFEVTVSVSGEATCTLQDLVIWR